MMIDTDKYEGHTPERWTVDEEDPCRVVDVQDCTIARTDFIDIEEEREWQLANARLIADAPKLLAEVNGLLAEIRQLNNIIGTFDDFMCNNWTPPNVHGLWNELLTTEEEE